MRKFLAIFFLAVALPFGAAAQVPHARNGERALDMKAVQKVVERLCDTTCAGRRTGTPGAKAAATIIADKMKDAGLKPLGDNYFQTYPVGEVEGCNVVGCYPGKTEKWIVVGAHYDHLGKLDGKIYPGADKNASGVGALLGLTGMFHKMLDLGKVYNKGLIFVTFDAKEMDLAGSNAFVKAVKEGKFINPATEQPIQLKDLSIMVNLDVLGSTLSPGKSGRKDFIIALTGTNKGYLSYLNSINQWEGIDLEIMSDYYGSADFTRIFYQRISDQKAFLDARVPSVMFTSGITMNTNKPADTPKTLDYDILKKRMLLIYYFLAAKL